MFKLLAGQPDLNAIEEEVVAWWRERRVYQRSETNRVGSEPYVIYDGPPTANAKPALHHMLPAAFKDAVGRYQTMRGRYVRRQVGWDTHGLPVEVQVEKKLGLAGKKEVLSLVPGDEQASIATFNEICRKSVWEFKQDWDRFEERVGYWADTTDPYVTYEPDYVEGVWAVFKRVWETGLVYKGFKVLPYCPRCGTALSAAEVAQEYQDVRDVSVFVAFPSKETPGRFFLAWTTTPWTLPGNVALAVNPNLTYVVIRQEAREVVLAKGCLAVVKGEYEIVEEILGSNLVGSTYTPPFPDAVTETGTKHVVIGAEFVTDADGTGIVHIAPMYGEDDFQAGQKEGLVMQHTVGLDGHFLPDVPVLAGLYVRDALGPILSSLQETGRLYAKETIQHSYPHCWRCKTPLMYYAKDSWFVAMSRLRERLTAANANVEWIPAHIRDGRFGVFLREARDWAISRERFWGTPLPLWKSETGEDYLCIGSIAELRALAEDPEQVGASFDPHRPIVDSLVVVKDGVRYRREPLVLDVWFDSGSMPYASGRQATGEFPADFIAEAVDQTRGWFYSLLALSTILENVSAYRRVVCMGHLVDEKGKKMSKSLGNVFDPFEMMGALGADSLRWFFYTVNAPGETKSFAMNDVRVGYRKSLLLVYNMVSYFVTYANLAGYVPGCEKASTLLDRWAYAREAETVIAVTDALDAADFLRASRTLEEYIGDLSTWYLRRSRKRDDQAFFAAFHQLLLGLLKMLAPFTPFMTEYLYRILRNESDPESVHLADWPSAQPPDTTVLTLMKQVRRIVELGQGLRADAKLKVRQPLAAAYVEAVLDDEAKEILADELNVIAVITGKVPTGQPSRSEESIEVGLDVRLTEDLLQAGRARELLRQLQNLRKQLGLRPGQPARLIAGEYVRASLEPLLDSYPEILADSYLTVDADSWLGQGDTDVKLEGETLTLGLKPLDVEPV